MATVKPDIWQPFYFGDYTKATGHLSCVEHGAYLLLLFTTWQNGGALPTDRERLRRISKMEREDWAVSAEIVLAFFYAIDGEIRHKRVDEDLAKANANIEQRSKAGTASAIARAENKRISAATEAQREVNETSTTVGTNDATDVQRNGRTSSLPSSLPSSVNPSPIKKEGVVTAKAATPTRKPKAALRLPDDWQPNAAGIDLAENLGLNATDVAERFRDHFHTTGSQSAKNRDWDRRWIRWCKDDAEKAAKRPTRPMSRLEAREQSAIDNQAEIDRLTAEYTGRQTAPRYDGPTIDGDLAL
jgi:uncharacterized protein YdaU (DUF1376 family)